MGKKTHKNKPSHLKRKTKGRKKVAIRTSIQRAILAREANGTMHSNYSGWQPRPRNC
ncbi:MAG TPA: hypothetical protein VJH89_03090 [Patescibacteria group bacterium]|nr:hypothetical protein [Patescibacteria group bacterium]